MLRPAMATNNNSASEAPADATASSTSEPSQHDHSATSKLQLGLDQSCCGDCRPLHNQKSPRYVAIEEVIKKKNPACPFCSLLRQVYCSLDVNTQERISLGAWRFEVSLHISTGLCIHIETSEHKTAAEYQLYVPKSSKRGRVSTQSFPILELFDIEEDPLSDFALSFAQYWITECQSKHSDCAIGVQGTAMPKRLVQIRDSTQASLVIPTGSIAYIALSHCWGQAKIPLTTTENVNSKLTGFSISELPLNFQDALEVGAGLGIEHVWIDSLCIVQNDKQEWAEEAAKMADIYKGAQVVVAAACAAESTGGFLPAREAPKQFAFKIGGEEEPPIHMRPTIAHGARPGSYPQASRDSAIVKRAWCYQERILAPRILYFERRELYFSCRTKQVCQCGQENRLNRPIAPVGRLRGDFNQLIQLKPGELSASQLMDWWMNIVVDYSKLDITYGNDILPALAGIASTVSVLGLGQYFAGLWEHGLIKQLLWMPDHAQRKTILKPSSTQQPSFSWASSPQPIQWPLAYSQERQEICKVIEVSPSRATPTDAVGATADHHIRLRRLVFPAAQLRQRVPNVEIWDADGETFERWAIQGTNLQDWLEQTLPRLDPAPGTNVFTGIYPVLAFDALDGRQRDWDGLVCAPLLLTDSTQRNVDGLILEPTATPAEGTYRRVGVFVSLNPACFEEALEAVELTIR